MAASKNSQKVIRKLNLQHVLNIDLFPIHIVLELDMLCVARKLVKDIVHF
jgi:hypothetical protein